MTQPLWDMKIVIKVNILGELNLQNCFKFRLSSLHPQTLQRETEWRPLVWWATVYSRCKVMK